VDCGWRRFGGAASADVAAVSEAFDSATAVRCSALDVQSGFGARVP